MMSAKFHNRMVMSVAALLLLAFAVSCNDFSYGYDENNPGSTRPNESLLKFSVLWDKAGVASSQTPQEVTVLMSRKTNTVHYVWNINGKGDFVDAEEAPTVLNGDYYTVAYSDDTDFYKFSAYDEFAADPAFEMARFCAELPEIPDSEVSPDKDLLDFNPYAGFVRSADAPLYIDIVKDAVFPSAGAPIVLHPRNVTRKLTFRLKVGSEDGVTVDNISAVLSGVACNVQLMSGLVLEANTAKVAFDLSKCGRDGKYDLYEGTVGLFGIFPPKDRTYVSGPGILQVSVSASVEDNGTVRKRVFHAGLNLKGVLDQAGLMQQSSDKSGYTMKPQSSIGRLSVDPVLKVLKNQIMSSETEGLYEWFENTVEITPDI